MKPHRWILLTVVLFVFPATPAVGQDLTFLQNAADEAAELLESAYGVPLTAPRYIDASAVRRVLREIGMPVPSVAELREALERNEPGKSRIIVVDTVMDAVERGPPDDPRLQSFAARAGGPPVAGTPEEVRWVMNDGIILRPYRQNPAAVAGTVSYRVVFTQYHPERRAPYLFDFRISFRNHQPGR